MPGPGTHGSRDAEVLSFRSLSSRVLAETGGLAEFTLDNGGKLLTMRRVLQELARSCGYSDGPASGRRSCGS